ncbi:MAG: C40 family peptidase [Lachnospira sp.]|nr:C40 family peptidase [Lachnospira sp.]
MFNNSVAYKCATNVSPKMMNPKFWIQKDETAENVRMDETQINIFNKNNIEKLAMSSYLYDLAGFFDAFGYGVCIRRCIMWASPDETEPLTAIYINEPLVIVKVYGEWMKIRCIYYEGWTKRDNIALFHSYEEWEAHFSMKEFIVVTSDYLELSGFHLDMGVKLELDMTYWNRISDGRYYNYAVKVPIKGTDGFVNYVTISVPLSNDVSVGFLPYTGANVLRQAYKMLGNIYGWGGTLCSRDCSALVMDIHRCFGIIMPRDVSGQMRMTFCRTLRFEDYDDWNCLRAGDIVGWKVGSGANGTTSSSHTFIYLGFDGEHYGLSAVGGIYGSCIINSISQMRDNGLSWQESVSYAKLLR